MTEEPKITCRTPTQGKEGVTRIAEWKYSCVRAAILDAIDEAPDGQIEFRSLADAVKTYLSEEELGRLCSVMWHVTTVKLNMEVEGELRRLPGVKPQSLERNK